MKSTIIWRTASGVMLVHTLGHCYSALTWKEPEDTKMQTVVKLMTAVKAPFMGVSRSMGEYYDGYGILAAVMLVFLTLMLWILSDVSGGKDITARKISLVICATLLLVAITELFFFFPLAALLSFLSFLLAGWGILT